MLSVGRVSKKTILMLMLAAVLCGLFYNFGWHDGYARGITDGRVGLDGAGCLPFISALNCR